MTEQIPAGTVVEVNDRANNFQYAVAVDQPSGRSAFEPVEGETVWVRYDNGCVVPVADCYVRALTSEQVIAKLNANR